MYFQLQEFFESKTNVKVGKFQHEFSNGMIISFLAGTLIFFITWGYNIYHEYDYVEWLFRNNAIFALVIIPISFGFKNRRELGTNLLTYSSCILFLNLVIFPSLNEMISFNYWEAIRSDNYVFNVLGMPPISPQDWLLRGILYSIDVTIGILFLRLIKHLERDVRLNFLILMHFSK